MLALHPAASKKTTLTPPCDLSSLRRRSTDSRSPTPSTSGRPSSARRATAADDQTLCEYPRLAWPGPSPARLRLLVLALARFQLHAPELRGTRPLRRSAAFSDRLPATPFSTGMKDLLPSSSSSDFSLLRPPTSPRLPRPGGEEPASPPTALSSRRAA